MARMVHGAKASGPCCRQHVNSAGAKEEFQPVKLGKCFRCDEEGHLGGKLPQKGRAQRSNKLVRRDCVCEQKG